MKSSPRIRLLGPLWRDSVACGQNIYYSKAWSASSCLDFTLWQ